MKNQHITLSLFLFASVGFAQLAPKAFGVVPAPDGGYPGGNTAEGTSALLSRTTGFYNTGIGIFSLLSLTDGNFCTGVGAGTLLANTADGNTATGAGALFSNTLGTGNTANGAFALFTNNGNPLNEEGLNNSAFGAYALFLNTTGPANTAMGWGALESNDTGGDNTAIGVSALGSNTGGSHNTAVGGGALFSNASDDNAAVGFGALRSNSAGFFNTATGSGALQGNDIGAGNTAVGYFALHNNITGSGNIAIGVGSGTNITGGDNNIYIGNVGLAGDSSTTRIGIAKTTQRTFIDGIRGVTTGFNDAVNVVIDSAGQLGTISSSLRFKTEIKPMDNASGSILALKPVTFRYKTQKDAKPQFGLIAEEVAEVNPDLVVRDENGEIYTVRYDAVNAMLLNEFLKEHKRVENQQATITELRSTVAQQQKGMEVLAAQLNEQAAQIQKVSAQIEMGRSAAKVVLNNQ
jgi:uncharacterized coiled-coil protein SlyX